MRRGDGVGWRRIPSLPLLSNLGFPALPHPQLTVMRATRCASCLTAIALAVTPSLAEVVSQWSFESGLDDTAPAGLSADTLQDLSNPTVAFVPGIVGLAVSIPPTTNGSNRLTAVDSPDLNLSGDWTLEFFVFPDEGNLPTAEWERVWTKWGEGGNEWHTSFRGIETALVPDGLDLFANGTQLLNHNETTASVARDAWSHVAFVGNAAAETITAWINGEQVGIAPYVAITPTTGVMNFGNFGTGDQSGLQYSGLIDDAMIHTVAVDPEYLQARAALVVGPPVTFRFTNVQFYRDLYRVTLTWTSRPNQTYLLEYTTDLVRWLPVADSIASGGDSTTFADSTIAPGTPHRMYRASEQ